MVGGRRIFCVEVLASVLRSPLLAVRILIEQIFGRWAPSSMAVAETDVSDWPPTLHGREEGGAALLASARLSDHCCCLKQES